MKSLLQHKQLPYYLMAPIGILVVIDAAPILLASLGLIDPKPTWQTVLSSIPPSIGFILMAAGVIGLLIFLLQQLRNNNQGQ